MGSSDYAVYIPTGTVCIPCTGVWVQ